VRRGARRREAAATGGRREIVEHSRAVGDDVSTVGNALDDAQDLARTHLRPGARVG